LRDGDVSPETLLLERHSRSEFLPDMYVFPGGRVDPHDHELDEELLGIGAAAARDALTTVDPELARGFFVAAIRETFEEAGILLARPRGSRELVEGERVVRLGEERLQMQAGELTLRDLLEREDLELAADLLAIHAHWITPEGVPRRFDTLFFSALAPADHLAAHDGVESTQHAWLRPEDALEQTRNKERQMIFPTSCNLEVLQGFASAREVFEASRKRPVVPVLPRFEQRAGGRELIIPPEAGYPTSSELLPGSPPPRSG
jgi:8-oxo-dGTP pyrophosphatase MutT (NUDIX family)